MIRLSNIRYVRLGTNDPLGATRFAREILGLELVRTRKGATYLRGDDRDHTLVYLQGDPRQHSTGFEVATADELQAAGATLESLGHRVHAGTADECEERAVQDFISFQDPSGNRLDLVFRPHHSGRRFFPGRDAGITEFSHIGLRSTDPARDEKFWTTVLGAKVSDRIGVAPLLRIDEVHHKIALFPSAFPGVQHINHQVESVDDVMRSWYLLREKGVKVVFGPGRHPTSGARFLYFEGPDGMIYEYSTGVRLITAEDEKTYQPRQFPFEPSSFCMWGSRPDIAEFRTDD